MLNSFVFGRLKICIDRESKLDRRNDPREASAKADQTVGRIDLILSITGTREALNALARLPLASISSRHACIMASIQAIEQTSVHQIQSGQVIVDLNSVVKELVENSLDAGSTSIEVRFRNHGLDAIEVIDNGTGIAPEDFGSVGMSRRSGSCVGRHLTKLDQHSNITHPNYVATMISKTWIPSASGARHLLRYVRCLSFTSSQLVKWTGPEAHVWSLRYLANSRVQVPLPHKEARRSSSRRSFTIYLCEKRNSRRT
jgi:hypothetical protein